MTSQTMHMPNRNEECQVLSECLSSLAGSINVYSEMVLSRTTFQVIGKELLSGDHAAHYALAF